MRVLVATKNQGKVREIAYFLGSDDFELVSLSDLEGAPDVEETGKTFEENAILKAKTYFEWSGIPSIADDAGLEIDYLHGEPGVKSRRWPSFAEATAGKPGREKTDQELIDLALEKLNGVPKEKRTAHLVAVGAYCDGMSIITERAGIDGYIAEKQTLQCKPGYPFRAIFVVSKFGKLYQELTDKEHEEANHRKELYSKLAVKISGLSG